MSSLERGAVLQSILFQECELDFPERKWYDIVNSMDVNSRFLQNLF